MTASLSDRIAASLESSTATAAEIAGLIAEAEAELESATTERVAARAKAVDPLTPSAEVPGARGDEFEADFKNERMNAAIARLKDRHERAVAREAEERRKAEVAEVEAEATRSPRSCASVTRSSPPRSPISSLGSRRTTRGVALTICRSSSTSREACGSRTAAT